MTEVAAGVNVMLTFPPLGDPMLVTVKKDPVFTVSVNPSPTLMLAAFAVVTVKKLCVLGVPTLEKDHGEFTGVSALS
jgi:hypothetical protein